MSSLSFVRPKSQRPDPSPSRWRYRLDRWWLTPSFRFLVRVGLPFTAAFGAATLWLSLPENEGVIDQAVIDLRTWVEERPEFTVQALSVTGASPRTDALVRDALGLDFPLSSFDFDIAERREALLMLAPVKDAGLRLRAGGVLDVVITERAPAVVWRTGSSLSLVDASGIVIAPLATRVDHPELPLIVGAGADRAVEDALAVYAAAGPLLGKIRGLVRVGERRWDVVFQDGPRVKLPEDGAVQALERVIVLSHNQDLLNRDIQSVDMRNPSRPTLRLGPGAHDEIRRIKAFELTGEWNE